MQQVRRSVVTTETKPLRWLTVQEYREAIPVSKPHVYRQISEGKIPHMKLGRKILIHPSAIELDLVIEPELEGE